METKKYFVCHKFRSVIQDDYARNFYNKKEYSKLHDNYEDAYKELRAGFYDDSDYCVYEVINGKKFTRK